MKIVFFGDSLTEGSYGGSYVNALRDRFPQHELINAGVGGSTVLNLLDRLDDDVLSRGPDGVFLMVGGNDAISYSQPGTRIYYQQVRNVPDGTVTPNLFSQAYREILERLRLEYIETWVGLPPAEYSPPVVEAQRQFNALASDAARSAGVPVLDLMPHFKPENLVERPPLDLAFINAIGRRQSSGWNDYEAERQRNGFTYTFDGLHPTPESARRMADIIAEFLPL